MRLVEAASKVGAGIGQGEAVATAKVVVGQPPHVHTATRLALDGDELQVVELARRLEQYARLVSGLARRRLDRPGRVTKREVDVSRVRGFVTAPGAHVRGERKLAALPNERLA